jgi:hypothetical protein
LLAISILLFHLSVKSDRLLGYQVDKAIQFIGLWHHRDAAGLALLKAIGNTLRVGNLRPDADWPALVCV